MWLVSRLLVLRVRLIDVEAPANAGLVARRETPEDTRSVWEVRGGFMVLPVFQALQVCEDLS